MNDGTMPDMPLDSWASLAVPLMNMAREARKVTADWRHPVDIDGKLIPMLEPQMADLMQGVRNHLQMYETTTEGTPMSPVFARAEELAQWLADHEIPVFGDLLATKEQWLKIIADAAESIPVFEKPAKMSNLIQ
jgi:hypothetical protein